MKDHAQWLEQLDRPLKNSDGLDAVIARQVFLEALEEVARLFDGVGKETEAHHLAAEDGVTDVPRAVDGQAPFEESGEALAQAPLDDADACVVHRLTLRVAQGK